MDTQRLPKKEEDEEEIAHQPSSTFESINALSQNQHNMDDFDSIFGISSCSDELTWDLWEDDDDEEEKRSSTEQEGSSFDFWDSHEDKELGLKLNLNHQEVIDAWSDRQQPLWTDDNSMLMSPCNALYRGEVPVMKEKRNMRREASVLRYKEKRQSRLFSKKIRYQVRKLNAEKRPRFKGRFVKRNT